MDTLNERLDAMGREAIELLPNLGLAILAFALFLIAARVVRTTTLRITEQAGRSRNLAIVLSRLLQWVVALWGALVALSILIPSFRAADLIQLLGITSVAIGFAFRDILQNFLAGILLLITEPFRIGDQIRFGEFEGTVEDIQTRATFVRTHDGRRVVIPNANLFTSSVTVITAYPRRRMEYDLTIAQGADIPRARQAVEEALLSVDGVLRDPPPETVLTALSDTGATLRARWWITPPHESDALRTQDTVLVAIRDALVHAGLREA